MDHNCNTHRHLAIPVLHSTLNCSPAPMFVQYAVVNFHLHDGFVSDSPTSLFLYRMISFQIVRLIHPNGSQKQPQSILISAGGGGGGMGVHPSTHT